MAANPGDLPIDPNVVDGTELAARLNRILPDVATLGTDKVSKYGDTMSGPLKISGLLGGSTPLTSLTLENVGNWAPGRGVGIDFSNKLTNDGTQGQFIGARIYAEQVLNSGSGDNDLVFQTADNQVLSTRMRIKADGKVGIGTSNPAARLDVTGLVNDVQARFGNVIGRGLYISTEMSGGTNDGAVALDARGAGSGTLIFKTETVERMRIAPDGVVSVGDIPAAGIRRKLVVTSNDANTPLALINGTTAAGQGWVVGPEAANSFLVYNQAGVGQFMRNGETTWIANSDERLKNIIEPISDAVNKVSGLRAVIGAYKSDKAQKRTPFLIAQDVKKVLPEAVDVGDDEQKTLGLAYTSMIPLLVAAIQELKSEVDDLRAQVASGK